MSELHTKLGRLLKAERERQNRSLSDISSDLKIAEGHLLAIEAGDVGGVPSELYFKLFARSYAEALGIDYTKAIEVIREDMGEPEPLGDADDDQSARPTSRTIPRPRTADKPPSRKGSVILLLIGLAVLATVVWLVLNRQDMTLFGDRGDDTTQTTQEETTADSDVVISSANRGNMSLNLDLVARDRTWAVVIADGDTALQTNLKPWREYYIGAQDTLIVSIGTPLAVELMLNGTHANLSDPENGAVSNVVITPENIALYLQRALEDSLAAQDSLRDTTAADTTAPADTTRSTSSAHNPGTGGSPSQPRATDSVSSRRGTGNGI